MILAAALAAAFETAQPSAHRTSATVQATATIRIVSAVRIKFDANPSPDVPSARDTVLRLSDGSMRLAKLIEFQ